MMDRSSVSTCLTFILMSSVVNIARSRIKCPAPCWCNPSDHIYCNGTGLTLGQVRNVSRTMPREGWVYNLSSNSLVTMATDMFQSVPKLKHIILSNNSMETLEQGVFKDIPTLQELDLRWNRFQYVPRNIFTNMPQLKALLLDHNDIDRIETYAFDLPALERLGLQGNQLTMVQDKSLSGVPFLQYLDLSHNSITTLRAAAFQELRSLKTLVLSHNRLRALPPDVFQRSVVLHNLDLSNNLLTQLNFLGSINLRMTLKVLRLDSNALDVVPVDVFPRFQQLETLSLANNRICTLGMGAFRRLRLDSLSLADNQLVAVDKNVFHGVTRLGRLNLSNNEISEIQPFSFNMLGARLYDLDLSGNKLDIVNRLMFSSLGAMQKLNLSQNKLWNILDGTFEAMEKLKELHLDHNRLQMFSAQWLVKASVLERLSILYNPLQALVGFDLAANRTFPFFVHVNLTVVETTTEGIVVRTAFRSPELRSWLLQVWCMSDNCVCKQPCSNPIHTERFLLRGNTKNISHLQTATQYYICMEPAFKDGDSLHISQCLVAATPPPVYDVHTNRGTPACRPSRIFFGRIQILVLLLLWVEWFTFIIIIIMRVDDDDEGGMVMWGRMTMMRVG